MMKRILLSLGVVLTSSLLATSQETTGRPAALGLPRATLGLPRAADANPLVIATLHAETALPSVIAPGLRAQETTPPPALGPGDLPKPMPNKALIGEEKKTDPSTGTTSPRTIVSPPIVSGPALPIVNADEPLFALPANAPPFINRERFKVSNEYLMWWSSGYATPALLSTGPTASNGILGESGVSVLYGNQAVSSNLHNGYRFSFTYWCGERWGIDGRFFFLSTAGDSTAFSSDTISLLARPFNDVNPVRNYSELIASPGSLTGGVIIGTSSYLWGADINGRRKLYDCGCFNLDGLIGYRYMNLTENLTITESAVRVNPTSVSPFVDSNGTIHGASAFDQFRTSNRFNGGQIGLAASCSRGRWDIDARASIAFGVTQASVDISGGQTVYYSNGRTATSNGGLLALDSNIGHHTSRHFAVIPEATFNVGYNITPRCRIFVGYNLIYWSHVLRPGNQINTNIDSARILNFGNTNTPLTNAQPSWMAKYSDYFAQGLNLGFSFRW